MVARTEHTYSVVLLLSMVSILGVFAQLLRKYTFVNLFSVAEVCAEIALQFNYSTFYTTGRLIGMGLGIITTLLVVKIIFSVVKTKHKGEVLTQFEILKESSYLQKVCKKLHIPLEKILIVKSSQSIAVTLGFFHPKIVLSSGLIQQLNMSQLEAVLLHEKHHFTHRHPILFCAGEIITQSFSFLPILKEVNDFFKQKLELEADQSAISIQKTDTYLKESLSLLRTGTQFSYFPAFSHPHYARESYRPFTWQSVVISLSVLSSLLTLSLMPVSVRAQTVGETMKLSNCSGISREDCATYCQSSGFSFLDFQKRQSVQAE